MKDTIYNRKGNLKGILFLIGLSIIISGIFYTQSLVHQLKQNATRDLNFRIKVFEQNINNPSNDLDLSFFFQEVIKKVDYPVIYTDADHYPQSCINISSEFNDQLLDNLSKQDSIKLWRVFQDISEQNKPIPIVAQGFVLGYYYYGHSPVINKLNVLPYLAIIAGALFILLGYLGFSYIRKSEQRYVWVGMAKETAHQLGTPLSALSGWVELLSLNPDHLETALKEIRNDIERLKKVTNRFSKIGSVPSLKSENIHDSIQAVVTYFHKRLPNMQKKILLTMKVDKNLTAKINVDLFEWVLENLIKNAIDGIGSKKGEVIVSAGTTKDPNRIYIDVTDSGKGVSSKDKTQIFRPGYSSKARGWGLGLSLSKRIIEEYHNGKLFLKESKTGQATVFRMLLNV